MNDRERLVELLRQAADVVTHSPGASTWGAVADYLISHGVTVQKHGRWEINKKYGDYECSVCEQGDVIAPHFSNLKMNYCPNCGAKMDGEA